MTGPTDGWFCACCGVHRTRSAGALCPVCSDERPAPTPPPRMALDHRCDRHPGRENHCISGKCGLCWLCKSLRSATITTTGGEL